MAIQYQPLPESYLADAQLPTTLRKFEDFVAVPYADSKGLATIGIGFNIRQVQAYLALVLKKLNVFTASDAAEAQRRQQNNLGAETEAERNTRYGTIVGKFASIISGTPIVADPSGPGNAESEQILKQKLDTELATYVPWGSSGSFALTLPQSFEITREIVQGFEIGPDLDGDGKGQFIKDRGKEFRLDTRLQKYGIAVQHDTREYEVLASLFFQSEGKDEFDKTALVGNGLLTALQQGNRAEAWYEIRYASNGNQLPGIAKRRYVRQPHERAASRGEASLSHAAISPVADNKLREKLWRQGWIRQ